MSISRLVVVAIVSSILSGCGKADPPARADDHDRAAAHPAPPATAPDPPPSAADPARVLAADEHAWQALAQDGPADAFCAKAAVVAADVKALPAPSRPETREALDFASGGFEKLTPAACEKPAVRVSIALFVHTALARAVTVQPLPYPVPPELQQQAEQALTPAAAAPANLADALQLVQADVDVMCACKDKPCFQAEGVKLVSLTYALANEHLTGTQEQGVQLRALMAREHECAVKLLGSDAP
jgi:hypothetical protein